MQIKYILIGVVIIVVIIIYYFSSSTATSTSSEMFDGKSLYSFTLQPGDFSIEFDIKTNESSATILRHGIKSDKSSGMLLGIVHGGLVLNVLPSYGPPDFFTNGKMLVSDNITHKIKLERKNSVWLITFDGTPYGFPQLGFSDYSSMYVGGVPGLPKFFVGTLNNFIVNCKPITLVKTLPV
jgi:hypothetical protein